MPLRSLKELEVRGQVLVVIGRFQLLLLGAVLRTKSGMGVRGGATTLTAGGSAMSAANEQNGGFSCL
jgi:hypothetical protein